jgi:peroxiredoxin
MVAVESTMLPLATEAPEFALSDPAGKVWSLDDVAGQRGTLVAFVCNHCPYVRHVAAAFGAAAAKWQAGGIGVIAINSNDTTSYPDDRPERMAVCAAEWNWTFPYVTDEDQSVALAYRAACTPDSSTGAGSTAPGRATANRSPARSSMPRSARCWPASR